MKFAIAALLGLITVQAVSLHQMKSLVQDKGDNMPSPDDIWVMCDTDGNNIMTKTEV
jgi:hypothetical protein